MPQFASCGGRPGGPTRSDPVVMRHHTQLIFVHRSPFCSRRNNYTPPPHPHPILRFIKNGQVARCGALARFNLFSTHKSSLR